MVMVLPLSATLDTAAAGPLRLALRQAIARDEMLHLDGAAVERVGQACLQVLIAARDAAVRGGIGFLIADPAPAFVEMAALAGFDDLFAV